MPEFKTLNNQLGETVYKELEKHIRKGSKVSTISAYFTMYAYSALKKELDKIDEMRFIFTTPSFSKNKDKEAREYEIVNNNIFGNEFELKLRNEMTQSAVAKDCAKWLKDKVEKLGWGCLTSEETGRIGGLMTKRKKELKIPTNDQILGRKKS